MPAGVLVFVDACFFSCVPRCRGHNCFALADVFLLDLPDAAQRPLRQRRRVLSPDSRVQRVRRVRQGKSVSFPTTIYHLICQGVYFCVCMCVHVRVQASAPTCLPNHLRHANGTHDEPKCGSRRACAPRLVGNRKKGCPFAGDLVACTTRNQNRTRRAVPMLSSCCTMHISSGLTTLPCRLAGVLAATALRFADLPEHVRPGDGDGAAPRDDSQGGTRRLGLFGLVSKVSTVVSLGSSRSNSSSGSNRSSYC